MAANRKSDKSSGDNDNQQASGNGFYSRHSLSTTAAPLVSAKSVNITHITQLKQRGGVYAMQFGAGDFKPEVLATLLTPSSESDSQLYRGRDNFLKLCANKDLRRHIFSKIWPNMHQRIKMGVAAVTADEVLKFILAYLDISKKPDSPEVLGVNAYLELMVYMLGLQGLIVPSVGFVSLDIRSKQEPTIHDIRVEAIRQELEITFATLAAKVKFPAKEMTPEVYLAAVEREFDAVVHHMESIDRTLRYVGTALAITRHALVGSEMSDAAPHPDALQSSALSKLMSNSTWVRLALTDNSTLSPERFDHLSAVNTVDMILNRSPRFEVRPLSDLAQTFFIDQVRDGRGNIRDVVISKNQKIAFKLKAGVLADANREGTAYRFLELPTHGEPLARAVEGINQVDLSPVMHASMTQVMADSFVSEIELKHTQVHIFNLTEGEIFALACHFADNVVLSRTVRSQTSLMDAELVFEKRIDDMRLFAQDLPIAQRVLTTDPITILACVPEHRASVALDTGTSTVPSEMFSRILTQDKNKWFHRDYAEAQTIRAKLGETELVYEIACPTLFAQDPRSDVALFRHLESEGLLSKTISAMIEATEYAVKRNENSEADRRIVRSVMLAIDAMLKPLLAAPIMDQLTDAVFRAMARKVTRPQDRELTYQQLAVTRVAYEIRMRVMLFMLIRAHLISSKVTTDLLDLMNEVEFFDMLNTADITRFLKPGSSH